MRRPPIAISYQPKRNDYLPVVVAAIRHYLDDWPIVLVTQEDELPPETWLTKNDVHTITNWAYSQGANKVQRLWDHQFVLSRDYSRWIWWHDDMLLLRPVADPVKEFSQAIVRKPERDRPNKELSNWDCWLWDTLSFFQCQGIVAPNPVLHIPRLIDRSVLESLPTHWDRRRLLFEPTYLLFQVGNLLSRPIREGRIYDTLLGEKDRSRRCQGGIRQVLSSRVWVVPSAARYGQPKAQQALSLFPCTSHRVYAPVQAL